MGLGRLARWAGPVIILLVAFAVRFPALPQKGIVHWDEAMLLNQARMVASGARVALARAGVNLPEGQFLRPSEGFEIETRWGRLRGAESALYSKPTHYFLLGFGMLALGEYPWAGQAVSAFLGVLTVALVYTMVRPAWGAPAALLAGASLAVSGWHAIYSAQALHGVNSLFLVNLALLFYWRALPRRQFKRDAVAAGACFGLAFTIDERALLLLPVLALSEVLIWLGNLPAYRTRVLGRVGLMALARTGVVRATLVVGSCAAVLGGATGLLAGLGTVAERVGVALPGVQSNYGQVLGRQFAYWLQSAGQRSGSEPEFLIFPYLTWQWDGLMLVGLVIAGLVVAALQRQRQDVILVVMYAVHYLFWSLSAWHAAQYFLPMVLPGSILAGRWLAAVPPRAQTIVGVAVAGALIVANGPRVATLAAVGSGYQPAAEMAIRATGGKHLSNYRAMTMYYTGEANTLWPEGGMESVRQAVRDGFWVAIVASSHHDPGQMPAWESEPELAGARLMAVLPNPAAASLPHIFGGLTGDRLDELLEEERRASSEIKVYDLRPLLASGGTRTSSVTDVTNAGSR